MNCAKAPRVPLPSRTGGSDQGPRVGRGGQSTWSFEEPEGAGPQGGKSMCLLVGEPAGVKAPVAAEPIWRGPERYSRDRASEDRYERQAGARAWRYRSVDNTVT